MTTTITSIAKTPQAGDDAYYTTEDYLTDGNVLMLNVMSNDLGGNAKKLWSIAGDDGNPMNLEDLSALLAADPQNIDSGSAWQVTAQGNQARIINGQIEYKIGTGGGVTNVNALAQGEIMTDTFTYSIRLGNGTLSAATVSVTIVGNNDAPVIEGMTQSGSVKEDGGALLTASGQVTSTDVDNGATATYSGNASGTYGSFAVTSAGVWTYTLANGTNGTASAVQSLAAGETKSETFTVTVSDGLGGTDTQDVVIIIAGTNDVPTIAGVSSGGVTEDATPLNLMTSGALTISDVDTGQSNFTAQASAAGTYGTFTLDAAGNWTYTANNSQSAIQNLNEGDVLTDSFTAVSSDGSNSQVVTVTINGVNDNVAPTADPITWGVNEYNEHGTANSSPVYATMNLLTGANAHDANGDALSIVAGSVTLVGGGALPSYMSVNYSTGALTIDTNSAGFDSLYLGATLALGITYQITDGVNAPINNTVALTITGTADQFTGTSDVTASVISSFNTGTWDGSFNFVLTAPTGSFDFAGTATVTVTGDIDDNPGGTQNDEIVVVTLEGGSAVTLGAWDTGNTNQEGTLNYSTQSGTASFSSTDSTVGVTYNSNTAGGINGVDGLSLVGVSVTADYSYWM